MEQDFLQLDLRRGDSTIWFGSPTWLDFSGDEIGREQASQILRGMRVGVFVHGYNVEEPMATYARWLFGVDGLYDVVVGVRWPGSQIEWAFWLACLRADKAGALLAAELSGLAAESISLVGHSLGCRVVLQALSKGLTCRTAVLAAAAVDDESLEPGERFGMAPAMAERVLVAYSRRDEVLAKAYRFAKLDQALGRVGPQRPWKLPMSVELADLSREIGGHSGYVNSKAFFAAWRNAERRVA